MSKSATGNSDGDCMLLAAIHIWSLALDASPAPSDAALSADERARAARFHFQRHRDRFVTCRTMLRCILGAWLGRCPGDVVFEYGMYGKPRVADDAAPQFSVTHSEHHAMIAVCRQHPIGIDLELVRPLDGLPQLIPMVFNRDERRQLAGLTADHAMRAFFRGWSRKEAYFKATGAGLSAQLHAVTVDLSADRLIALPDDDVRRWSMHELPAPPDFVTALAVPSPAATLIWRNEPIAVELPGHAWR